MSGLEALERIRRIEKEKKLPEKPFIVLTGNATEANRKEANKAGANDFLTKPLNLQNLA